MSKVKENELPNAITLNINTNVAGKLNKVIDETTDETLVSLDLKGDDGEIITVEETNRVLSVLLRIKPNTTLEAIKKATYSKVAKQGKDGKLYVFYVAGQPSLGAVTFTPVS